MTQPTRWSDASSDADPVLRAVMRYAQDIEPSPQDVASWAAAVAHASADREPLFGTKVRSGFGISRRTLCWTGGLAFAAMAGVALGMTIAFPPVSKPVAAIAPEILQTAKVSREPSRMAPVDVPSVPSVSVSLSTRNRPVVSAAASSNAPFTELSLLTEVRRELRAQPGKSLVLLTTHASQYPNSSFAEERAALRVEALFRVGRTVEAERDYDSFVARFPESVYTPRLIALRPQPPQLGTSR